MMAHLDVPAISRRSGAQVQHPCVVVVGLLHGVGGLCDAACGSCMLLPQHRQCRLLLACWLLQLC
jgi:hypothetical protein